MYKTFYNLQHNPFEITPDPSFLCPTKKHNEALAALYYGVRHRKGFVVVTGEVGTGKTLLVRCLFELLKGSDIAYAYVFNSRLSPLEFLQYMAGDLGLPTSGQSKSKLLLRLASFLINRHNKRLITVLVADEAHHLSAEVLEEIRLLTNLETGQAKLLQILLVGQPELDDKLDSIDLRQLKQRISLRARLQPLDSGETHAYILRRLRLAGVNCDGARLFPVETIATVHRVSHGIPRLINTVCENALLAAFAKQLTHVPVSIIEEVAGDLRLNIVSARPVERIDNSVMDNELLQAIRTMLQLHAHLQVVGEADRRSPLIAGRGEMKNEPYI